VGGVEPQVGPLARRRPLQEGAHPLVDLLAELRDGRLRDARQAHRPHQAIDAPGGDAADPGLMDDGHQRPLGGLPRLREGREVAALPQLRDPVLRRGVSVWDVAGATQTSPATIMRVYGKHVPEAQRRAMEALAPAA